MLAAAAALPPGSGIVVRDDDRAPGDRWRLVRRLARIAKTRNLLLLLAGPPALARRWGAGGVHLRRHHAKHAPQARRLGLIVSMPVHDPREAHAARRARADLAFVSPLHPTRSHPGAPALGRAAWLGLARLSGARPVALGGLTPARARAPPREQGKRPHPRMGGDRSLAGKGDKTAQIDCVDIWFRVSRKWWRFATRSAAYVCT